MSSKYNSGSVKKRYMPYPSTKIGKLTNPISNKLLTKRKTLYKRIRIIPTTYTNYGKNESLFHDFPSLIDQMTIMAY